MKLSTSISKILLSSVFLTSSLYAQDIDTLNNEVKQLEKQLADLKSGAEDAKDKLSDEEFQEQQKRIANNIAKAKLRTSQNILKKARSEQYKRAQAFMASHADYTKNLRDGKVRKFPEIVENWSNYQQQLEQLTQLKASWESATDVVAKQRLGQQLMEGMEPIGQLLRSATHKGSKANILSKEDQVVLKQLDNEFYAKPKQERAADAEDVVILQSSASPYTLKHLPVPIVFSAPAGTEIILSADTAGRFANDLPKTKITADEQGVAKTWWVSNGDAVSTCLISFKSVEYTGTGTIHPIVKRLELVDLEALSPVVKAATNRIKSSTKPSLVPAP